MNPITYAGESYRSFDRRRNTRPRATQDNTVYEDLDEPNRSRSRKLIDYGDI